MIRRLFRSDTGAAMVEFAVMLPFLLLLVTGVIEMGRYMSFGIVAAHAASAGAQYGAQNTSTMIDTNGITAAVNADSPGVTWTHVLPTNPCYWNGHSQPCTSQPSLYYVNVTVTGRFQPLFAYPGIPTNFPVTANVLARVNLQR